MNNNRIVLTMVIDCIKKVYFGWNFFSNELSFFTYNFYKFKRLSLEFLFI